MTLARCAAAAAALREGGPRRAADAALYLAHVEGAAPLRRIADAAGRSLGSVHRAVRRVEALRDDPLMDHAFDALGELARAALTAPDAAPEDARLAAGRIAHRALGKLAEPESFLMIATGATKAGVFCRSNRFRRPLALLTLESAAGLAARGWIRCVSRTAVSAKYAITEAGRDWLRRAAASAGAAAAGAPDAGAGEAPGEAAADAARACLAEAPVSWLARRAGADGRPFLGPAEVEAGERLREDFERAWPAAGDGEDWRAFLGPVGDPASDPTCDAAARARFSAALTALGAGLADAAFLVCCRCDSLGAVERRLGWSARSAKVVLRIALERLAAHYAGAPAA
jgi:hypothetical protein